jgi:hypothetical protein
MEVFISYRHENEEHRVRVREFALRLRGCGIEVVLDQLINEEQFNRGGPDMGWATWSCKQARECERVLVIASAGWFACYEKTQSPGEGLGAAAEAHLVQERLYAAGQVLKFARIVYFDEAGRGSISTGLKTYPQFDASRDFDDLTAWLKGIAVDPVSKSSAAIVGWMPAPPLLDWPIADCDKVRDAFAALLVEGSPHRVLLVEGKSEVGKTRLTRHLLNVGTKFKWLACGRFDLKGVAELDREFSTFVTNLDVDSLPVVMTDGELRVRLDAVLTALTTRSKPTLLIFDTFDVPSKVTEWLKDKVLLRLPRAPWLRLVIVGQKVPSSGGTAWADFATHVELHQPTWEDWYRYGKAWGKNLDEDFVRKLFDAVKGQPALLDQVLAA